MVDVNVARLDSGHLTVSNEISEGYPPVTNGLRDFFPLLGSTTSTTGTTPVLVNQPHYDYLNGFCFEDGTTNLWAPTSGVCGWQTNYAGTVTPLSDTPYPRGVRLYKPPEASAHASQGHWHGTWGATLQSFVNGTTYCASFWYRKASPNASTPVITVMKNDWTGVTFTTIASYIPAPTYEWQRGYRVFTMGEDVTARVYIYFDYGREMSIDVCGMQLETRNYPTNYVDSSRATTSDLHYTLNINKPGMSFVFEYSSRYTWDNMQSAQAYDPMLLQIGSYYGNGSFSLWTISKNNILAYVKGDTGSGWQIGGQNIRSINKTWWDNQTHHYVVVFYSDDGTGWSSYAVYIDNVKYGPFNISPKLSVISNNWYGTNDPRWGGMYRNLIVYDKSLSDTEVNTLYNWSMQIKSNGLNVRNLEEGDITASAIAPLRVFPLANNVKSLYGAYAATTATGIVFEDGACYVGKATTNLGDGFPTWANQRANTRVRTPDGLGLKFVSGSMSSTWSGNSYYYSLKDVTATLGQKYTFSAWCYVSEDFDGDWVRICGEQRVTTDIYYDMTKKGTWQRLSHTYTVSADGTARFLCYASKNGVTNGAFNGYFIFGDPQIELEAFRTPPVYPSRTASDIQVATRDINLTLSSNFTIYGWFKLADRHQTSYNPVLSKDDGTPNRLLIMVEQGQYNDNLVAWFGDADNGVAVGFGSTVEKDKWIFFAFRRSGEQVLLSIYKDGVMYSNSNNLGSYFNAQTSTNPWKFGLWAGHYLDGWIRDFVFVQSALTDEQIDGIAKGTLRLTKRGLEVEGLTEEAL